MENETYESINNIANQLVNYLRICDCQRKIKSIINVLVRIYNKSLTGEHNWTEEEYLILALLDSEDLIEHGINCEYPIIITYSEFWQWVNKVKDNPNLRDL